ncbi:hypothetical protein [Streptomyces sp. NBC_01304]|uniref:hypothetical protein n=1 Tax=Streptomyces sp. NBC_01304 TaxID=2903818 RepID=UPI002E129C59|nr:hypothetical protein OG430_03350 [Streptomyces sp. NBC_01304]
MKNSSRTAAAGAAALLAAGLVVAGAGQAGAAQGNAERITSAQQLQDSIQRAVAHEQQSGVTDLGINPVGVLSAAAADGALC